MPHGFKRETEHGNERAADLFSRRMVVGTITNNDEFPRRYNQQAQNMLQIFCLGRWAAEDTGQKPIESARLDNGSKIFFGRCGVDEEPTLLRVQRFHRRFGAWHIWASVDKGPAPSAVLPSQIFV
jgi:hypothetical protein